VSPALLRVACAYALLVVAVWVPFTLGSGMPHEHSFALASERAGIASGFVSIQQPPRALVPAFHHLAYVLGELAGVGGSFVPYQIVFAWLWWARGLLVFLIADRLAPGAPVFAAGVGGLSILHASDHAVSWVGGMAIEAALVWLLACFFACIRGLQAETTLARRLAAGAAAAFGAASLATYESGVPLLVAVPLLWIAHPPGRAPRRLAVFLPLACVLLVYLAYSAWWYTGSTHGSYQTGLLRSTWSARTLLADVWFNLSASVRFWSWGSGLSDFAPAGTLGALASLAAGVFALALGVELWLARGSTRALPPPARSWRLAGVGVLVTLLAFPVFLLIEDVRSLWRTQLLSAPGCALLLAAAAAGLAGLLPGRWLRECGFVLLAAAVAWFGARAALNAGAWHRHDWERHRQVMARILELAPDLARPTVFVLVGVPRDADPFLRYNAWFERALELAYPGRPVAGIYFRDDGTPAPGPNEVGKLEDPLAIGLELAGGELRPLRALPAELPVPPGLRALSDPSDVIHPGPPAARALRRYGTPSRP
jgi:hypothetical protein